MNAPLKPKPCQPILIVGSGNGENIIKLDCEFECNQKHTGEYHYFVGGSGVNYALRLAAAGFDVVPVLPVGNDTMGGKIKKAVLNRYPENGCPHGTGKPFIRSRHFFMEGVQTPLSTIVIDKNQTRTVFSEQQCVPVNYRDHVENALLVLNEARCGIGALIIGHIHSDSPKTNPEKPGCTTRYLINRFAAQTLVCANFGNSQIGLGIDFWEPYLRDIHVFQLNWSEMRQIFRASGYIALSLTDIVHWFMERSITALITLDGLGALGIHNNGRPALVWAPGHRLAHFMDSTGAGDAFMAGLVSRLQSHTPFNLDQFARAMAEGQVWAEYACTSLGASSDCPTLERLGAFKKGSRCKDAPSVEILDLAQGETLLKTLIPPG